MKGWTRSAEAAAQHHGFPDCGVVDCPHDVPWCGARYLVLAKLSEVRRAHSMPDPIV